MPTAQHLDTVPVTAPAHAQAELSRAEIAQRRLVFLRSLAASIVEADQLIEIPVCEIGRLPLNRWSMAHQPPLTCDVVVRHACDRCRSMRG